MEENSARGPNQDPSVGPTDVLTPWDEGGDLTIDGQASLAVDDDPEVNLTQLVTLIEVAAGKFGGVADWRDRAWAAGIPALADVAEFARRLRASWEEGS